MRRGILAIVGLLILSVALFGCGANQIVSPDPVPLDDSSLPIVYNNMGNVFAIANESGNRLITFTPISDVSVIAAEGINTAIGSGGQYLSLEFVKKQNKTGQDTGRVIASNFDNMEGYIYNILAQKAVPNQTYYVGKKETIPEKSLLISSLAAPIALNTNEMKAVSDAKGRIVQEGWILADYGDGTGLEIAVFKPQGKNYLMSILLRTKEGGMKFMDYAAVSDGASVWRVDDGGKIDPALFSIRLAARTDKGFLAVISWAGAEGENTFFLLEQPNALQEQPATAYRYWSPA